MFLGVLAWHLVDNDIPVWSGGMILPGVWGRTRMRAREVHLMRVACWLMPECGIDQVGSKEM
jgi:hypothetical protein